MRRIALALLATLALIGTFNAARAGWYCANCPVPGLLNPPANAWTTPYYRTCTPVFAGGDPLMPLPDELDPHNVLISAPFYQGPPPERPRERMITEPVRRPIRPGLSDIQNPDTPRPRPTGPSIRNTSGRLHLVILADKKAKDTGKTNVAGAELFERLLREGVRVEMIGRVEKDTDGALDTDAILKTIGDMSVQPDDTLVVYYAGPAEWNESGKNFVLAPTGSARMLPRETLVKSATDKKARLTVVLTDPAANPFIAKPPSKPEVAELTPSALEHWFFNFRGVVDVHASSPSEFAAARGEYGGVFTLAFIREFGRPAGNWADMFETVKFSTSTIYKSYRVDVLKSDAVTAAQKTTYRNQETQVPTLLTPINNVEPVKTGASNPATTDDSVMVKSGNPARLDVHLPANAKLWIDGRPTLQAGTDRMFELPVGPDEGDTLCELRIEVNNWFGIYRVTVSPGKTVKVDLKVPTEVADATRR